MATNTKGITSGFGTGAITAAIVLALWQRFDPTGYPLYPKGAMAYMMPNTLAANRANLILLPAEDTDTGRSAVVFLCSGLEQWQDEGVDPVNHRWCKPL
jgi:hypothetical protein